MRHALLLCLLLAGCRMDCPTPPEPCIPPACIPEGWHCGEIRVRVLAVATTGASYAILADGTRVYVPPEEMSALRTGDWYCGPIGIYAP